MSTQTTRRIAFAGIGFLVLVWCMYLCGARINRTHSLPKGLYWVVDREPERGDYVTFWPQDTVLMQEARRRGYIISGAYNRDSGQGYGLILKKLAAVPGDVVSISSAGVVINDNLIPNSSPFTQDNIGDPLPPLVIDHYRLREGEALFISDHLPRSFDSRYFGIQELRQIVDVLVPVWVW